MSQSTKVLIEPNKYYHVFNRGVNRRTIFKEEADFQKFMLLCEKYLEKVGRLLAYALMPNHFHLTVLMKPMAEIPISLLQNPRTVGNTFGHIQNAYAKYFNAKYDSVSALFEHRFERKKIETIEYFRQLVVYQHRNPEKHGFTDDFRNYLWTSYQELSHPNVNSYVDIEFTLKKFGGLEAFFRAHEASIPFEMMDFEFTS